MERGKGRGTDKDDTAQRLEKALRAQVEGMHRLGKPAVLVDTELPASLAAVYSHFDGGELFHETLVLWPSARITAAHSPDGVLCYGVGEMSGDDLFVDARGRVYRREEDSGEWLLEGSRFDRWLLGVVESEIMLYDADGEFVDEVFDDSGEVAAEMSERMNRRILKRDRHAPAPRWRLARALIRQSKFVQARDELEQVVGAVPAFAWAWFDLAQISEELGEYEAAMDEFVTAAEAIPDYDHAGFFWAHAARIAAIVDDDAHRADYASRALELDPHLVRAQREGAQAMLEQGDLWAARRLAALAVALAPRDLAVLDLVARIREQVN